VFLNGGETYTVRLAANVCGLGGNCTARPVEWRFTTAAEDLRGRGDTRVRRGFGPPLATEPAPLIVTAVNATSPTEVAVAFSRPVMNVTSMTLSLAPAGCAGAALPGKLSSNPTGDVWTYRPQSPLQQGASYCVRVTTHIYDLDGQSLAQPVQAMVRLPAAQAGGR
jgi:hypothetical protein